MKHAENYSLLWLLSSCNFVYCLFFFLFFFYFLLVVVYFRSNLPFMVPYLKVMHKHDHINSLHLLLRAQKRPVFWGAFLTFYIIYDIVAIFFFMIYPSSPIV